MLPEKDFTKLCDSLQVHGFKTYKEFLASETWKVFSKHLRTLKSFKECKICRAETYALHHNDYGRLLEPRFIVPVCKDCHNEIHRIANSGSTVNIVESYKKSWHNHRSRKA